MAEDPIEETSKTCESRKLDPRKKKLTMVEDRAKEILEVYESRKI